MSAEKYTYDGADNESTEEEPCSQGELLDFLIAEAIAEYQDPSLTLKVNHITTEDIRKIEQLGWTAEMYNEDGRTMLTVHQQ
ncbi:hypothetical protein [Natrinema sp. 74]|uniref:hypothetical protein n=1 Tax=Natrinema sp. 74 TaxID=3384159 RepID=UPI0038D3863B